MMNQIKFIFGAENRLYVNKLAKMVKTDFEKYWKKKLQNLPLTDNNSKNLLHNCDMLLISHHKR